MSMNRQPLKRSAARLWAVAALAVITVPSIWKGPPSQDAFAQESTDPPPNTESQYRDALSVAITNPSQDGFLMWINQSLSVTASITDSVQYSNNGGPWYNYGGPDSPPAYSIQWSANLGSFTDTESYTTTYLAPDWTGSDTQAVTLTAHAVETSPAVVYGSPAQGAAPQDAQRQGGAQQATVSADSSGKLGDAQHPFTGQMGPPTAVGGGGQLGWLQFNNPAGCEVYGGAYYLKATTQANPVPTFAWYQDYYGHDTHTNANGTVVDDLNSTAQSPTHDITGTYGPSDNTDLFDAPNYNAGANNNNGIPGQIAETTDETYLTWVEVGGARVSNKCQWQVKYALQDNNGQWAVNGSHTP
jgi:hypothetical protein